ncbi:MAG TPA: DUF2149 domain-containing protein [Desulfitobacteriaceae bacterium]|nr:DUF2149 domain-containing protein [Desulfitobacteriaceae bacterium]
MIRNRTISGRRRSRLHRDDINPLDTVVNLVDVMLIFACGLMVAVIMHWNVDLTKVDIITEENLIEVKDLEKAIESGTVAENYDSMGMVYQDPKTGKMYLLSK